MKTENYGIQILGEKRNDLLLELDDLEQIEASCEEKRRISNMITDIDDVVSVFQAEEFRRILDGVALAIAESRVSVDQALQAIEQFNIPQETKA